MKKENIKLGSLLESDFLKLPLEKLEKIDEILKGVIDE